MIFPPFAIPAAIIAILSAVIYAAESLGHPFVTKALAKGASQNVVAKYTPNDGDNARSRKIVLVAHYDTGKVKPALVGAFDRLPIPWPIVFLAAMIVVPVLLLVKVLFLSNAQGVASVVMNVLIVIAAVLAAFPAIKPSCIVWRRFPRAPTTMPRALPQCSRLPKLFPRAL